MTNVAAIGYAIIASKEIGLTEKQIFQLERLMTKAMDERTEEEAEDVYLKS